MLLRPAVGLDLLGMLLEVGGEAAVAGGIADEIEVVGLGRVKGSPQGGDSGVADGPGRQAGVVVGVVRRGRLQVGGVDGAAPAVFQQRGVDDGGSVASGMPLASRLTKTPATRGRSVSWLTSFSISGGHDDGRGPCWFGRGRAGVLTWRKRCTMAVSIWSGVAWREKR